MMFCGLDLHLTKRCQPKQIGKIFSSKVGGVLQSGAIVRLQKAASSPKSRQSGNCVRPIFLS